MSHKLKYTLLIGGIALAGLAHGAPQANPGQWQVTTSMTMHSSQGDMNMPPSTIKTCIKPQDAGNLQKHFSSGPHGQQNPDCQMVDHSESGDTVHFHMKCSGAHPSDINGQITYASDSYKGQTDITATGPHGEMHMHNEFSAKRLGGC